MQSVELTKFVLECRGWYNKGVVEKIDLSSDILDWYEKSPLDYVLSSGVENLVKNKVLLS